MIMILVTVSKKNYFCLPTALQPRWPALTGSIIIYEPDVQILSAVLMTIFSICVVKSAMKIIQSVPFEMQP